LAQERDIAALAELYVELHAFHVDHLPDRLRIPNATPDQPDPALEQGIRRILADADSAIFVADIDGRAAGLAEISVREPDTHPLRVTRRYAHLQSLVVSRQFRHLGVGVRLIEAANTGPKSVAPPRSSSTSGSSPRGRCHFMRRLVTER